MAAWELYIGASGNSPFVQQMAMATASAVFDNAKARFTDCFQAEFDRDCANEGLNGDLDHIDWDRNAKLIEIREAAEDAAYDVLILNGWKDTKQQEAMRRVKQHRTKVAHEDFRSRVLGMRPAFSDDDARFRQSWIEFTMVELRARGLGHLLAQSEAHRLWGNLIVNDENADIARKADPVKLADECTAWIAHVRLDDPANERQFIRTGERPEVRMLNQEQPKVA